jgi:6-phosphogluconolactonase (cycloisomerase 2 family)
LALSTCLAVGSVASVLAQSGGSVFTLTNSSSGNELVVLRRTPTGNLEAAGSVGTGGIGLGASLGSQGSVALSDNGQWIAVVNPGDDTVSILRNGNGLPQLVSMFPSGGVRPISASWHGKTLYVLNDGDAMNAANVRGFDVSPNGSALPISGAAADLSTPTADPAQVQFSPDGDLLVVTEKNTDSLTIAQLAKGGSVIGVDVQPSAGATPFGFDFDNRGRLFVSEAFGGSPLASATSSYRFDRDFGAVLVSGSVPTMQTAACWLDVSPDGRWAYVANTGSGTVSSYRISHDGSIRLAANSSLGSGAHAVDIVTSPNGKYVHVINSTSGSIVTFRTGGDGTMTKIDEDVVGLGIVGIATR